MQTIYLSGKELYEIRMIVQKETGYMPRSSALLSQTFRRSSFAAETGTTSNEIFEFLGDHILSYYVVKIITDRCGSLGLMNDYTFRIHEGKFTQIKQSLVNNEALAEITNRWGLAKYLRLGRSDLKNDVINERKVLADLFEAVLGAIAIDCNHDTKILERVVKKALDLDTKITTMIESDSKVRMVDLDTAVTALKEYAEQGHCTMPTYSFYGPESLGYDPDGNPKWSCSCSIINERYGITKTVTAASKKDAKKTAAYLVLCEQWDMQNKYGENSIWDIWIYKDGKLFPKK